MAKPMFDLILGPAVVYWDTGARARYHNFEKARRKVLERFNTSGNLQHGPATIKRPHSAIVLARIAQAEGGG